MTLAPASYENEDLSIREQSIEFALLQPSLDADGNADA